MKRRDSTGRDGGGRAASRPAPGPRFRRGPLRRLRDPAQAAEAGQQRLPPAGADAGHPVERRTERVGPAALAVEGDGETVRLVPGPFEEVERRGVPGQLERFRSPGQEDLLLALRETRVRDVGEPEVVEGGGRRAELAAPAVHQDQVRKLRSLGEHPPVAAEHDLAHRGVVVGFPLDGADAELPVSRGERLAALEDHHRGHHLAPAQVGDVEGFDAARLGGELEGLLERADPGGGLPSGLPEVEVERQPRVPAHEVHHAAAGALHRDVDLDPSAAFLAEPVGHQFALGEVERRLDPGRGHAPHLVELLHRRFHEPRVVHRRQVGKRERVPVHHLAAPDQEHLQLGAVPFPVEAEHVAGLALGGGHLLAVVQLREQLQAVAQPRGLLEAFGFGLLAHAPGQRGREFGGPAEQEQPGGLRRLPVFLHRADRVHAGRDAAADLVLEARTRALPVELLAAVPDAEEPVHQAHAAAGQARREIGARVHRAVGAGAPDDVDPRVLLVHREPDERRVLVVPEEDVVAGPARLDEVVLEVQGLARGVGEHHLHVGDLGEQVALAGVGRRGAEVREHPRLHRSRLADVQRLPLGGAEEVDPGALGEPGDLVLKTGGGTGRHLREV